MLPRLEVVLLAFVGSSFLLAEIPTQLPDPDDNPGAKDQPVQVYILSGQSNMVGMGDIYGGSSRWGKEMLEPMLSIYEGAYDAEADYEKLKPVETRKLEAFGGTKPTPYGDLQGKTAVVRGFVQMSETGVYQFNPGYGGSVHNVMTVDGTEVHRQAVGEKQATKGQVRLEEGKRYPFRIVYFNEQANGLGWARRGDIPGLLSTLVKEGKFPHLVDEDGHWTERKDVIYKGVISATGQGPLKAGVQGNTIGPELGFGHVMGHHHDAPVLLIKASIGNRSLGWDILPPGGERFVHEGRTYAGYGDKVPSWIEGEEKKEVNWYAGKQYDDYTAAIHEVLKNFDTLFPQWKDQGYEIGGFVWWQGHKDGNDAHAGRYEQNLVQLIKTWRTEFEAPKAPWTIATVGFGGWKMEGPHAAIAEAQLAVSGETGQHPEFKGNVKTIESRDFWREVDVSPRNQDYHYHRNAETYYLVGDALGRAMVDLKSGN